MTVTPKAQGDLDGLCGPYAIVNAYQFCGKRNKRICEQIFQTSCSAMSLRRWPKALWDGTEIGDMRRMLRKCQSEISELANISVSYPFQRNAPGDTDSYWDELDKIWRNPKAICAIVGVTKPGWHWSVIKASTTSGRIVITDSDTKPASRTINKSKIFAGDFRNSANKPRSFVRSQLILFSKESTQGSNYR